MEIGFIITICVIIYLIVKGIEVYGILILLLGILGMIGYFADMIWRLLFNKGKIYIFPVLINIVLIVVGGLLTFDYITGLNYINKVPNNYQEINKSYIVTIDEQTYIEDYIDKYIDNTLEDNKLRFEITYYSDMYDISEPVIVENIDEDTILSIKKFKNQEFRFDNKYFKEAIDNLKNKEIYNYSLLDHISIKVYSNEATFELYR